MSEYSRKVKLMWKRNPTTFELINSKVIGETPARLGGSVSAIAKMVTNADEIKMLMPMILSQDPNSTSSNWDKNVKDWFNSLTILVPSTGLVLETGLRFDIDDSKRERYINELKKKTKIETSEDLMKHVMGNNGGKPLVQESDRWKYGNPINVEQYIMWRYALVHRHVANSIKDADKSEHIRFYLFSEDEENAVKRERYNVIKSANEKFLKIIASGNAEEQIDNVVAVMFNDYLEMAKLSSEDKQIKLYETIQKDASKFLDVVDDKNLAIKAQIEKLIHFNVLRRLPSSSIIIDADDPAFVLGNNLDEAVTNFVTDKNKVKVNEYVTRYKAVVNE
jgi:hypothetical protein